MLNMLNSQRPWTVTRFSASVVWICVTWQLAETLACGFQVRALTLPHIPRCLIAWIVLNTWPMTIGVWAVLILALMPQWSSVTNCAMYVQVVHHIPFRQGEIEADELISRLQARIPPDDVTRAANCTVPTASSSVPSDDTSTTQHLATDCVEVCDNAQAQKTVWNANTQDGQDPAPSPPRPRRSEHRDAEALSPLTLPLEQSAVGTRYGQQTVRDNSYKSEHSGDKLPWEGRRHTYSSPVKTVQESCKDQLPRASFTGETFLANACNQGRSTPTELTLPSEDAVLPKNHRDSGGDGGDRDQVEGSPVLYDAHEPLRPPSPNLTRCDRRNVMETYSDESFDERDTSEQRQQPTSDSPDEETSPQSIDVHDSWNSEHSAGDSGGATPCSPAQVAATSPHVSLWIDDRSPASEAEMRTDRDVHRGEEPRMGQAKEQEQPWNAQIERREHGVTGDPTSSAVRTQILDHFTTDHLSQTGDDQAAPDVSARTPVSTTSTPPSPAAQERQASVVDRLDLRSDVVGRGGDHASITSALNESLNEDDDSDGGGYHAPTSSAPSESSIPPVSADTIAADQNTADQANAEQITAEQATTDQATADQAIADQINPDQITANQITADQITADQATADQATADQNETSSALGSESTDVILPSGDEDADTYVAQNDSLSYKFDDEDEGVVEFSYADGTKEWYQCDGGQDRSGRTRPYYRLLRSFEPDPTEFQAPLE